MNVCNVFHRTGGACMWQASAPPQEAIPDITHDDIPSISENTITPLKQRESGIKEQPHCEHPVEEKVPLLGERTAGINRFDQPPPEIEMGLFQPHTLDLSQNIQTDRYEIIWYICWNKSSET